MFGLGATDIHTNGTSIYVGANLCSIQVISFDITHQLTTALCNLPPGSGTQSVTVVQTFGLTSAKFATVTYQGCAAGSYSTYVDPITNKTVSDNEAITDNLISTCWPCRAGTFSLVGSSSCTPCPGM